MIRPRSVLSSTRSFTRRLAFAGCVAGALVACGGTSSETPWPVEPDDVLEQPVGEANDRSRPIDVDESVDQGGRAADEAASDGQREPGREGDDSSDDADGLPGPAPAKKPAGGAAGEPSRAPP